MLFSKLSIFGLLAVASAAPQYGGWDNWRDERSCRDHRGDWDIGSRRCREARREGEARHEAWEEWRDERSCREHSYRWDARYGRCGRGFSKREEEAVEATGTTIQFPDEFDHWRDERSCRDHRGDWDIGSRRCRAAARAGEARHEAWEEWKDERSCLEHKFRWDRGLGRCGRGYVKREETAAATNETVSATETDDQYPPPPGWRRGGWDDWRDRRSCEEHSYRWDVEHNRCGEVVAAAAAGNAVGAIANAVGAIAGGALAAFGDRPACERAYHRWDERYGRCY